MLACQAEVNEWVCDAVVAEAPAEQGEPAEHLQGPPAGGAGQVGCILQLLCRDRSRISDLLPA